MFVSRSGGERPSPEGTPACKDDGRQLARRPVPEQDPTRIRSRGHAGSKAEEGTSAVETKAVPRADGEQAGVRARAGAGGGGLGGVKRAAGGQAWRLGG